MPPRTRPRALCAGLPVPTLIASLTLTALLGAGRAGGATIEVPTDQPSVQAGIMAAASGDTVLVAPGTWTGGGLSIDGKNVVLASRFLTTGDPSYVAQTVLDGGGAGFLLRIANTHEDSTAVVGLTLRNADDGIRPFSRFRLLDCIVTACNDGVDYEAGSGGIIRGCTFEENDDDGIDLDDEVDVRIESCVIRNNSDDGIEIRLQPYTGPVLVYAILDNVIHGNGEDGIQLIDYDTLSARSFHIQGNLIYDNAMAGIGCMGGSNTQENYEGASIPEPIFLSRNVFDLNNHAVTGGDNVTANNNIVMRSTVLGMKNVDGASTVSYSCFWQNGTDFQGTNFDAPTLVLADPLVDATYHLRPGSPCIDAGHPACFDPDWSTCDIGAFQYVAPPVGVPVSGESAVRFLEARPNPFSDRTVIEYSLPQADRVSIGVYDVRGRRIRTLSDTLSRPEGVSLATWDGTTDSGRPAAAGIYFLRIRSGQSNASGVLHFVPGRH